MNRGYLRAALRWFRYRGLALAIVFACGLVALLAGVGVSDRGGVPEADLMTKIYYTLGLFVLGGMDLGVPQGGPSWARGLLWTAYFAAPVVTASALVEGVLRMIDPESWRLRRLNNHIVIAGAGNLALLYLQRLRETDPLADVVVVEKHLDATNIDVIQSRYRAKVVHGDIATDEIMSSVNLPRARQVLFLTGDDFANLEAATTMKQRWPELAERCRVHVSDLMLRRVLARTHSLERQIFNSHQVAAKSLVESRLSPYFKETPELDQVVLAGFGRFGQTVLDELLETCPDAFDRVVIVDIRADRWMSLFSEHRGDIDHEYTTVAGDMTDPQVWGQVAANIEMQRTSPVIVLGSDQDELNIQVALWLRARLDAEKTDARLFVRCFRNTALAEQLGEECGFEVVSVASLISKAMGTWL
jgi:voltage-gated potassium channel Kch